MLDVLWVSEPGEEMYDPEEEILLFWSGEEWTIGPDVQKHELVWNGEILYWNHQFVDYVNFLNMPLSEPVDVTLVTTHARTLIAAYRAASRARGSIGV